MSENQSETKELLIAALGAGVDLWTALEGVGMTMQDYNLAIREPGFNGIAKIAEETGRNIRERIESMRAIVATYDETVDTIRKRAVEFRRRKSSRNLQMDLIQ